MEYGYSAIESFVDFCNEMMIAEEGYNMEIYNKFKASKKRMRQLSKDANSLMEDGRYKEATNKLVSIKTEIGNVKKMIKSHPDQDSVNSAVIGYFTSIVLYIGDVLLALVIVGIPAAIKDAVYQIMEFVRGLKDDKVDVRSFNAFRVSILAKLTELEDITDKMIRECKASASNHN